MCTELDHNDTHEKVLLNLLNLKHRLNFMTKIQVKNGEEIKREELSAMFESFSDDMEQIISTYQEISR